MLVNCTNHPVSMWGDAQLAAAEDYGAVVDLPFPNVDPKASPKEIRVLVNEISEKIDELHADAVLASGEFSLTFMLVDKLLRDGKTVLCACSERRTTESVTADGSVQKRSTFVFEQFRPYERY